MPKKDRLPIDQSFDVAFANEIASLEAFNKHLYRPNTYFHKWWARRCGSTFRMLLKSLVEDETKRDYYTAGGLEGKVVLDPMMGGGTTIHEAIRLGANVFGLDVDPIPVLQAKVTLTKQPLQELENRFHEFHQQLTATMESYYVAACPICERYGVLRFMLYGLRRRCDCGQVLLVSSKVLRQEPDGTIITICPDCHRVGNNNLDCNCPASKPALPIKEKGVNLCSNCGATYREEIDIPYYSRYVPITVVSQCEEHGINYASISEADKLRLQKADYERAALTFLHPLQVRPGPKSNALLRRGISNYRDLFTSRQLIYIKHASEIIQSYDPGTQLWLSLLVSTSLEFNSLLCGYKGSSRRRSGAIRHVFAHHGYSFPYTALENNPTYPNPASGTLLKLFHDRVRRARLWAESPRERVIDSQSQKFVQINNEVDSGLEVKRTSELGNGSHKFLAQQGSAANLGLPNDSVDFIVTDPPYFDSVQYSDLGAFFRVWLQQLLPDRSQIGINWDYDLEESAVSSEKNGRDRQGHYTQTMGNIFSECNRVLRKDSGRLIFTFHSWNPEGWSAITNALKRAGFGLVNRYVVHSENPISVHIANLRALTDDAILVLAPIEIAVGRSWAKPAQVDTTSSAAFCRDCATLLGWMLTAEITEEEVRKLWMLMLKS